MAGIQFADTLFSHASRGRGGLKLTHVGMMIGCR